MTQISQEFYYEWSPKPGLTPNYQSILQPEHLPHHSDSVVVL